MKKIIAVFVSVLFYIFAFILMFLFSIGRDIRLFIFGFPLIVATYFVIAGNIFFKCINLNRLHLWLSINFIGGLCSFILLLLRFTSLLFNGFVLLIIGFLIVAFAVVWLLVGLGFICVRVFKQR